jgi:hypothetical protein
MMHEPNSMPIDDPFLLDKLVDGELAPAERRQLLMELENQPDGWRRCALAFLESQAFCDALGSLSVPPKESSTQPLKEAAWRSNAWGTILAAAASFLIAFGLGLTWRGQPLPPNSGTAAQSGSQSSRVASVSPKQPVLGLASDDTQWGTMTVSLDRNGDGKLEPLELPIARGSNIDEKWVRDQPLAFPSQVKRELERMGHEVRQQRQYYPFDLGNGARVLVPVDEVDVRYVNERQFQ